MRCVIYAPFQSCRLTPNGKDLRVWTIFRAEVAHFKTQHLAYRKTGYEWEILGDLGLRLHHREEAKEAYQRCLDTPRYSPKPWLKLMEMYADEGDIQRSIQTAIRVAAYQYADYTEMTVSFHRLTNKRGAHVIAVSYANCSVFLQTGPNTRTCEDIIYAPQHGPAGPHYENHEQLLAVRKIIQS